MDSNPYRSRLNGLDWSATPIQSSHSIANTVSDNIDTTPGPELDEEELEFAEAGMKRTVEYEQ